ncbi:MAG: hypothetical protein K6L73_05940 [Cellvibrionaceae bacterium]
MLLHLLAALSLWLSFSPILSLSLSLSGQGWLVLLVVSLMAAGLVYSAGYHWYLLGKGSVTGLYFSQGQWRLLCGEQWIKIELEGEQLVWGKYQLLSFRNLECEQSAGQLEGSHPQKIYRLLIVADAVVSTSENLEEYRKLRVLLNMGMGRLLAR